MLGVLTQDRPGEKDQTEREQHYGNDVVYAGPGRPFVKRQAFQPSPAK
jgi:hypothetical protein